MRTSPLFLIGAVVAHSLARRSAQDLELAPDAIPAVREVCVVRTGPDPLDPVVPHGPEPPGIAPFHLFDVHAEYGGFDQPSAFPRSHS